jgi:hypothetical protein
MAGKKTEEIVPETAVTAEPEKKKFKVLRTVLGDHVDTFNPAAKARSWQHKRYQKGSFIYLDAKDAKPLLASGFVEAV